MTDHPYRPNSRTVAQDKSENPPRVRLGHRLGLAWLASAWEEVWPRLWAPATIAGSFVALALTDVLPHLPGWFHAAVLAAFVLGFCFTLWRGLGGLTWPTNHEARRRLERKSGLTHRPLTVVRDRLSGGRGDAQSEEAWTVHQHRARKKIRNLRVGAPSPGVARRDPWAVRGAVLLLLLFTIIMSWGHGPARVARALTPAFAPAVASAVTVEAWITPPEYTGLAPRMVSSAKGSKTIEVPDGAKIMLQVHGGKGAPRLTLGKQGITLQALDGSSYQAEVLVKGSGNLKVRRRGRTLADWPIKIIPDAAPTIRFAKKPSATPQASVRIDYKAQDDYRVAKVRALVARRNSTDVVILKIPVAGTKTAAASSYHDLASHPWAGSRVSVVLQAVDDLGQKGKSKIVEMVLPERVFRNPVARAIIRERKRLINHPFQRRSVVKKLGQIAGKPQSFHNDKTVYLALRSAQARLILDRSKKAMKEVVSLLWDTALRVEDGGISVAERELRRLQKELMAKLNQKNVTDKELRDLIDKLQKAMREYMRALMEDMAKNPQKYQNMPINPDARTMTQEDMRRMFDRMRDMARAGSKEALQRMLSQFQNLMQQLRSGRAMQRMDRNNPGMKAMRDLQDIIRQQQRLLDQTFRQQQRQRSGQPVDPKELKEGARKQEELRKRLGDLMRRLGRMLGKVPRNLGNAERQMNQSRDALGQRMPGRALGPQGRAIEELRRGARQAMRGLGRRFGRGIGMLPGTRQQMFGRDRDPLGRRLNGMGPLDTNDVKVPTEAERQRAREILDELRRRWGEINRPKLERDYIDRLLRQF